MRAKLGEVTTKEKALEKSLRDELGREFEKALLRK